MLSRLTVNAPIREQDALRTPLREALVGIAGPSRGLMKELIMNKYSETFP
jgi:hypothetical protein